ncbi:glycosyltransferase family 2 protein [Providencia rettgeri]|uniref:glycosyltransferase family 2 protein n=1 Tax=Providencia rettgeri TaxID=587 RepID=UPI00352670D4
MQNLVLLSVIIPCYNNADHLFTCLNSLPKNDLIEIIIINDGSTDRSESEINNFISVNKNMNIILVNQENSGVSMARNKGIELSSGKYITFLDADDLWSTSLWETIKPVIIESKSDMVIFNASRFYNDNLDDVSMLTITRLTDGYHVIHQLHDLSGIFESNGWFSWCRIYKKELFNGIKFPEGREYEDLATIPVITSRVKNIFSISDSLILYRSRSGSITRRPKEKHIDDIIHSMRCLYNMFIESDSSTKTRKMFGKTMQHEYSLLRSINKKVNGHCYFNSNQQKQIKELLKPFCNDFTFSLKLKAKFIYFYSAIAKINSKMKSC